jgi:hypothetical protein
VAVTAEDILRFNLKLRLMDKSSEFIQMLELRLLADDQPVAVPCPVTVRRKGSGPLAAASGGLVK